MENRGKATLKFARYWLKSFDIVTVYTEYGYASVDLDKYKDALQVSSAGHSPEKHQKDEGVEQHDKGELKNNVQSLQDKIIEVNFKWGGIGYIPVSIDNQNNIANSFTASYTCL